MSVLLCTRCAVFCGLQLRWLMPHPSCLSVWIDVPVCTMLKALVALPLPLDDPPLAWLTSHYSTVTPPSPGWSSPAWLGSPKPNRLSLAWLGTTWVVSSLASLPRRGGGWILGPILGPADIWALTAFSLSWLSVWKSPFFSLVFLLLPSLSSSSSYASSVSLIRLRSRSEQSFGSLRRRGVRLKWRFVPLCVCGRKRERQRARQRCMGGNIAQIDEKRGTGVVKWWPQLCGDLLKCIRAMHSFDKCSGVYFKPLNSSHSPTTEANRLCIVFKREFEVHTLPEQPFCKFQ